MLTLRITAESLKTARTTVERLAEMKMGVTEYTTLGMYAADAIVERTERGVDANDRTFRRYSDDYAERRREAGRRVHPPNLTWTGSMLASLTAQASSDAVRLFFSNAERGRIAEYHVSRAPRTKLPRRDFLGVGRGSSVHRDLESEALRLLEHKMSDYLARGL